MGHNGSPAVMAHGALLFPDPAPGWPRRLVVLQRSGGTATRNRFDEIGMTPFAEWSAMGSPARRLHPDVTRSATVATRYASLQAQPAREWCSTAGSGLPRRRAVTRRGVDVLLTHVHMN